MSRVAVVLPTHSRASTMPIAARSVLRQSVTDLELLLSLDGPTEAIRQAAADVAATDPRVRVLEFPKAPGHGRENIQRAIRTAGAPVIAYISDDDLWLPHHLETLLPAVEDAGGPAFAHTLPLWVDADGSLRVFPCDLERTWYVDLLRGGENRLPPTHVAHTRDALDGTTGWSTPDYGPSDLWVWRQVLARPEVRRRSVPVPTALVFPTPRRPGWSDEQRGEELEGWRARLDAPDAPSAFAASVVAALATALTEEERSARSALRSCGADRDALIAERPLFERSIAALRDHAAAVEEDRERMRAGFATEREQFERAIDEVRAHAVAVEADRERIRAELAAAQRRGRAG